MALSAQQIAAKWARNLTGATEAMRDGVQAVTISPTEKAAAQAQAYADGVARAVADGRWQAGLRRVSLDSWKQSMLNKGVPRIATGASNAQPKFEAFMNDFMPYVRSGQNAIASMPRGDFAVNMQRAYAMAEWLHRYKRKA